MFRLFPAVISPSPLVGTVLSYQGRLPGDYYHVEDGDHPHSSSFLDQASDSSCSSDLHDPLVIAP
jgi:hypothetical protein